MNMNGIIDALKNGVLFLMGTVLVTYFLVTGQLSEA